MLGSEGDTNIHYIVIEHGRTSQRACGLAPEVETSNVYVVASQESWLSWQDCRVRVPYGRLT